MPSDTPTSGCSVVRTDLLPHGADVGADMGPRKRLRLDNADAASTIGDVDLQLDRKMLQILGLPNTTSLSEVKATAEYVNPSSCISAYFSYFQENISKPERSRSK